MQGRLRMPAGWRRLGTSTSSSAIRSIWARISVSGLCTKFTGGFRRGRGGYCMDFDPEFSQKSSAELNSCLLRYTEEHEIHTRAVAELSKREKAAEDKIAAQFTKAI